MVKTILVTGASRGIGLEFVRQYLEAGGRVHACCRRPEEAQALAGLVAGGDGVIHPLDVTCRASIRAMAEALEDEAIDLLVNNAGVGGGPRQRIGDLDYAIWEATLRTNAIGPYRVAEALVDRLDAGAGRTIANVSSLMGSIADNASGGSHIYRTAKTALNMVTANLARDLAGRDLAVLAIHPGWVRTDMGGAGAPLTPADSVAGMRRLIDAAGPEQSGGFFNHDGRPLDW